MESLEAKKKAGRIEEELRELERFTEREDEDILVTYVAGPILTILCCA